MKTVEYGSRQVVINLPNDDPLLKDVIRDEVLYIFSMRELPIVGMEDILYRASDWCTRCNLQKNDCICIADYGKTIEGADGGG